MRVITANVNGIRAFQRKDGLGPIEAAAPDVLCLQEVRSTSGQLVESLAAHGFLDAAVVHAPSEVAGRNGVAIVSRYPLSETRTDLPGFDGHGRWIEARAEAPTGPLRVASVYVPKGGDELTLAGKRRFLTAMSERMAQVAAEGVDAVVAGDINVARTELDLRNWRNRIGKSGFLDWERAELAAWAEAGWVDVGRRLAGEVPGPYTWWSNRGRAFDNDVGWRIDYVWASAVLGDRARGYEVLRAPTWDTRPSDHATVIADFGAGASNRR